MSRWAGTCTLVGEDVERDEFGVARAKPRKRPVATCTASARQAITPPPRRA